MTTDTLLNVDDLAQEIRRVDGMHSLGAGALAEALMPFIERAVLQSAEVQRLRADAARLDWIADQTRKSPTGASFDYGRRVEDGLVVERGYRFMRRRFLGERLDDLRAAIDAAKERQP